MRTATRLLLVLTTGLIAAPIAAAVELQPPQLVFENRVQARTKMRGPRGDRQCVLSQKGKLRTRVTVPASALPAAAEFEFGYVTPGFEEPLFGPVRLRRARGRKSARIRHGGRMLRVRRTSQGLQFTFRRGGVFLAADHDAGPIAADLQMYARVGDERFTFSVSAGGEATEDVSSCDGEQQVLRTATIAGAAVGADIRGEQLCRRSDAWVRTRVDEILASASPAHLPLRCVPSTTPVFTNADPFDMLAVTIRADFDVINGEAEKDDARSPGTVNYVDPVSGETVTIDCTVEARGGSRFDGCRWRPLRLRFDEEPVGSLFEGNGTQIKIVNGCDWDPTRLKPEKGIAPGTPEENTRRLLQEFVLYELLATVGPALETRLMMLTYEDPSGTPIRQEFAFFREREKRAAQRCGFSRLELEDGDARRPADPTSDFQARFHHMFLFSHDFDPRFEHNVVRMGGDDGTESYIPYDFDLSGLIQPTYFKNDEWSYQENGRRLVDWLRAWPDQDLVRAQVAALLDREAEMRAILDGGPIDDVGRERLQAWFDDHVRRLKCLLE